jgi:hypothetical protein
MEEGRMAGLSAAYSLGYVSDGIYSDGYEAALKRMLALRSGMFGQKRRDAKAAIFAQNRG